MATKLDIACAGCGATGFITLDINIATLNVGGKINVSQPCPICGGEFSAPGGCYEKNDEGKLVRVGDFEQKT